MANLTAAKLKGLTQPGRYRAGAGLYLVVAKGGSRSWVQRITIDGRRVDRGLGGYPAVSLAQARRKAADNKASVAEGRDPWVEARAETEKRPVPTFEEAARTVHALNVPRWSNPKNRAAWIQRAERYVFPMIGSQPVDEISRAQVLGILTPLWTTKPETARRVRLIVRSVFAWALSYGFIQFNPGGEAIDGALPAMPRVSRHLAALPYQDVAAALHRVERSRANPTTKSAFRFLVLTAARSAEVRGALWREIDEEEALWTIPAERMKTRRPHRVPLSTAALEVLEVARSLPESQYVFPSFEHPDRPLSENALSLMLRKRRVPAVPHGFRTSFRTWASEQTSASHAAMELSLSHVVGSAVEQAYNRTDLLEQRRALMQQWADYIEGCEE